MRSSQNFLTVATVRYHEEMTDASLAIAFANTWYAVRGKELEGLRTPAELASWLRRNVGGWDGGGGADAHADADGGTSVDASAEADGDASAEADGGTISDTDLAAYQALRTAIRSAIHAVTEAEPASPADLDALNKASASVPSWTTVTAQEDGTYTSTENTTRKDTRAALATIARATINLLSTPLREDLRACHAPGCVQYFLKDHPRREWCSTACGHRARAARHYTKQKAL